MSFSKSMSSGRRPGVIGMLRRMLVFGGVGFYFTSAMAKGGGTELIEAEISQQGRDIESLKASLAHGAESLEKAPARNADVKELARLKRENQFLQENIGNLQKRIVAGKAEIVRRNGEFEAYKDEYRAFARAQAKDEILETLTTVAGVIYKNVNIREVTPLGMEIRHAEGHKRIPFEDLPEALRERFQFDPKQKEKAIAKESVARNEHEAAVGVASVEEEKKLAAQRQVETETQKEKARLEIAQKQSRISSLEGDIENLNDAIQLEAKKKLSRAGIMQGQISSKRQEIAELQSQISNLQMRL